MLDLGANVDCTAEHLLQFAVMGSALVSALKNTESPSVGLLNIGEELIKGSEVIKRAGELLRSAGEAGNLNLLWQFEGNDHLQGRGGPCCVRWFRGNVALNDGRLASLISGILQRKVQAISSPRLQPSLLIGFICADETCRSPPL